MFRIVFAIIASALLASAAFGASAHAADMTCVASWNHGVTCINAQGMKTYTKANSTLPQNRVRHLAGCGDRIAVAVRKSVVTFDGKTWAKPIKAPGSVYYISCGAEGMWIVGSPGVSYWDGKNWSVWKRPDIFTATPRAGVRAVAAGPNGTAWVISDKGSVAHYDGKAWTVHNPGEGLKGRIRFLAVAVDRKGRPWVVGGHGLHALQDGNWKMVVRPGATKFLVAGPKGRLWMGGGGPRAVIYTLEGDSKTFKLPRLQHGAVDGKGRLWVATKFGIGLWTDGKLESRQMHNSDLADDKLVAVAVIGNGGELPAKVDRKLGSVAGQLEWRGGGPVAGAQVQLCGSPTPMRIVLKDKGPCGGLPLTFQSTSDNDGKFGFDKVPPANYRVAVQGPESGKWILINLGRREYVAARQSKDFGKIRVPKSLRKK